MKYLTLLFCFIAFAGKAQNNGRFSEEVERIQQKYDTLWNRSKETTVFTGSSSIRLWKNLEVQFPEHQIINTGFGGSQAADLLQWCEKLVLRYKPQKVFIYEGDNDLAHHKRPKEVLRTIQEIIHKIRMDNPESQIVLISAKPSISRWGIRGKYKRLNRKFKKLSKNDPQLEYADVWTPMLSGKKLKKDIFVSDGLHMNAKGYDIWYTAIEPFMNN